MVDQLQLAANAELELRRRRKERLTDYETQRAYYQTHPLDFMVERLGVKKESIDWASLPQYGNHRWDGTENPFMQILNGLVNNEWVGVESGTSTGKTFMGACIVLWFLECFEGSLVVTTAPKQDQLSLHIWREISRLFNKFNKGTLTTLKLRMQNNEDWLAVGFVAGVKADEESSTKAQGFHAEHMLIIFEETPGVPVPIITAFQNTSTAPHNLILAFGNPDHQQDNLHKFCKMSRVKHIRISGYDHPNVVLNDPVFTPGAQTVQGLANMLERYGDEENPLYISRGRGISPGQSVAALIKIEWFRKSNERYLLLCDELGKLIAEKLEGDKHLGVDVANSEAGDKAALAEGQGRVLKKVEDFHCPDSNVLGKRDVFIRMKDEGIKDSNVGVDGIGVGAGTVNALKEIGLKVQSLIGSESAIKHQGEEEFNNLRSQMWWQLREDLRNGEIDLPPDEELLEDLSTPQWSIKNGKIVIESKDDFKKRLGHSPNKGDAVVYWNWTRAKRKLNRLSILK